ncbi:unnamed protein product, partial [Allacma fusca]
NARSHYLNNNKNSTETCPEAPIAVTFCLCFCNQFHCGLYRSMKRTFGTLKVSRMLFQKNF